MSMMLIPIDGSRPILLDKAIVFFGRGAECDIVLKDSRKVSRKHCCIAQIDDYFVVRDLGSMNGVRVNDQLIDADARLNVGDELWVGDVGFRLQVADQKKSRPAASRSPQRRAPVDPRMLSQDFPVAIPDEGIDFQVEATRPRKVIPKDEIIEISDEDILG